MGLALEQSRIRWTAELCARRSPLWAIIWIGYNWLRRGATTPESLIKSPYPLRGNGRHSKTKDFLVIWYIMKLLGLEESVLIRRCSNAR